MRILTTSLAACLMTAAALGAAEAKTTRITCDQNLSLVYDGDDSGTLTLTGPYGEASLPAIRQEQEGMIGIRGSGETKMLMPDKAALEACVSEKAKGETDSDIIYMYATGCGQSLAPAAEPVSVNALVEITVIEPPGAQVFITRTYTEATTLPGGKIELPSFPMPQCTLDGS